MGILKMNSFQIISSIVIPLIAIITAIIAYQQFYINKIKLRHDLYEIRARIYREILRFTQLIRHKGEASISEVVEFRSKVGETEFIFDQNILGHIENIYKKGVKLAENHDNLVSAIKDEEKIKYTNENNALVKWFSDQVQTINPLFKDYLLLNEAVKVNPENKGFKRLIITFGLLLSCIWLIYYSITVFKLEYLFSYKCLMYPLGLLLSFLIPYFIYKITFWIILGFNGK